MIPITKFVYSKKLCGQIQDIFNEPMNPSNFCSVIFQRE